MGMAAPTVEEIFDTEFLTALQGFSLWARRIISGGRHAEQLSRDKGAGLEFADYKAYVPGDDTRTIDWNIYRRLGRVVVKVFEERQELPSICSWTGRAACISRPLPRSAWRSR